jgi:hypothetical protein
MGLSWGTPVKVIDAVTVAAEAESDLSAEIDLNACVGVMGFTVVAVFNAAATAGAALNVYPCYDGVNYAGTPVEVGIIDLADAGASTEQHVYFPISCRKVKVAVENLDAAQSITGVSVWAHKQTLSA